METVEKTNNIYNDQTGKFPMNSSRGNKYVLIMYVYDANAILSEPLKSKSSSHILEAYTKKVEHMTNRGYRSWVHWIDNEASASLKKYNQQ